jgi:hypothetical protein
MKTTYTVDASSTTLTPVAALSSEERWDDAIASALNKAFIYDAEDESIMRRPPYFPFIPLPWDRTVSEFRDYPDYAWNRELIRMERAFSRKRYDICYQIADELKSIALFVATDPTRHNEFTTELLYAVQRLKDTVANRECQLVTIVPESKVIQMEPPEQHPILWKAR